jgi:hypothetical protein
MNGLTIRGVTVIPHHLPNQNPGLPTQHVRHPLISIMFALK